MSEKKKARKKTDTRRTRGGAPPRPPPQRGRRSPSSITPPRLARSLACSFCGIISSWQKLPTFKYQSVMRTNGSEGLNPAIDFNFLKSSEMIRSFLRRGKPGSLNARCCRLFPRCGKRLATRSAWRGKPRQRFVASRAGNFSSRTKSYELRMN